MYIISNTTFIVNKSFRNYFYIEIYIKIIYEKCNIYNKLITLLYI